MKSFTFCLKKNFEFKAHGSFEILTSDYKTLDAQWKHITADFSWDLQGND